MTMNVRVIEVSICSFSTSEYKMNSKKRRSISSYDDQAAFKKSSNLKLIEDVFVTPEMTKFVEVYLSLLNFHKKYQCHRQRQDSMELTR